MASKRMKNGKPANWQRRKNIIGKVSNILYIRFASLPVCRFSDYFLDFSVSSFSKLLNFSVGKRCVPAAGRGDESSVVPPNPSQPPCERHDIDRKIFTPQSGIFEANKNGP